MHFVLPNSLLPDNKDLDFWLHQETKTAQVCASATTSEKKQLPTDNLSTWLSTRYAANLTKKSSETAAATAPANLDMWLAEKRRKLCDNHANEEISKWLLPGAQQEEKRKRSVADSMATMTLNDVPAAATSAAAAARLCPALSNWQANADMPLDSWLVCKRKTEDDDDTTARSNRTCSSDDTSFEWLLRGPPVAEVASEFVYACDDLPVQEWLAQPPPAPVDQVGMERLAILDPVETWIDESEFDADAGGKAVAAATPEDEMSQWLLVENGGRGLLDQPAQDSLDDGSSSIVVLDTAAEDCDEDTKSVASSWKFW